MFKSILPIKKLFKVNYRSNYMIGKLRIPLENGRYDNYYGEIRDNMANGFGKSKNNKGESYIGNFINNKKNGQGTWMRTGWGGTIETYSGQWKDNERHGQGKYSHDDGSYSGGWKDGEQHGMGKENYGPSKYDNGGQYVGEWVNGSWKGFGVWTDENDTSYKGVWGDGGMDGIFVITDDDGHSFERGIRYAVCDKTYNIYSKEPYAGSFELIEPMTNIPLDQATDFNCKANARRPAQESKGQDYKATTEASNCCEPSSDDDGTSCC